MVIGASGMALATLVGCKNQADPTSISDGSTQLTDNMLGETFNGPGGKFCRWWIVASNGRIVNNGNTVKNKRGGRDQRSGRQAEQSQTFTVYSSYVGAKLKSDDCGPWEN